MSTRLSLVDTDMPAQDTTLDIFSQAAVLHLQFRRFGAERNVPREDIAVSEGDPLDRALLTITKRILDSPELKAIERHDRATGTWVESKKAGPAFANVGGFHLIPNALKPKVEEYLDERQAERDDLITQFLATYDQRVAETRPRLGSMVRDVRYPSVAEAVAQFTVTRSYMTFGYLDPTAARTWQAEALADCRALLRTGFADVVTRLAERLSPSVDADGKPGKPKIFRDTLVTNFDEFVAEFSARNIGNDTDLAALVTKARTIMAGIGADDLRSNEALRTAIGKAVATIDSAAAALVMEKPSRFYGE